MKFDVEEQAFIQELIDGAYQKAYAKATESAATAKTAELEELLKKSREGLRDAELKGAAARHGAHNPADVAFLLKDTIKIGETGELQVVDEDRNGRHDKSGNPLTIEGLIADFQQKNAHFFKTAVPTTGSGGFFSGIFGR